jgi:hypothetical protein
MHIEFSTDAFRFRSPSGNNELAEPLSEAERLEARYTTVGVGNGRDSSHGRVFTLGLHKVGRASVLSHGPGQETEKGSPREIDQNLI